MARLRVYVAGAYSGPDVLTILGNMRRGITLAAEVLAAGFAPFCPWLDYHFSLARPDISLQDYYDYSLAFLDVCAAVLVVPEGADASRGTQAELARARELSIPIFRDLSALQGWAKSREEDNG